MYSSRSAASAPRHHLPDLSIGTASAPVLRCIVHQSAFLHATRGRRPRPRLVEGAAVLLNRRFEGLEGQTRQSFKSRVLTFTRRMQKPSPRFEQPNGASDTQFLVE